jgi:ParB-like chromosome segregation protein Spo0J
MKIESVPIASLVEDPANARRHPQKNLEAIKGSLARFGQQKPLVVGPGNVVIAGNGTLRAARTLGWETIAIVRTSLDGVEKAAYAIADNRSGETAEWDDAALIETLQALQDADALEGAGFSEDELERLLGGSEDTTPQLGGLEFRVVVDCADEADQAMMIQRLEQEGRTCRALMS